MSSDNSQSQLPVTNRQRDLEGLRQAVELITGDPTTEGYEGQSTSVTKKGVVRRTISVQDGLPGEANGHELLHVLHTPRRQPKAVEDNLLVHAVWNALEDGRINRIGNKKFGRNLKEVHEEEWQRGFDGDPMAATKLHAGGHRQNADALALSQVVFGVSGVITTGDKFRDGLLNKMRPNILKVIDTGDGADVAAMAVKLAYLFDLMEEKRQEEGEERGRHESEAGESSDDEDDEDGEAEAEEQDGGASTPAESDGPEGNPGNGGESGDKGEEGAVTSDREDVTEPATAGVTNASGGGAGGDEAGSMDAPSGRTEYDAENELAESRAKAEGQEEASDAEGDTELEWDDEAIEALIENAEGEAREIERKAREAVRRAERSEEKREKKVAASGERDSGAPTTIGGTYSYPQGKEDHIVHVIPDNLPIVPLNPGLAITELSAALPGGSKRDREMRSGYLDTDAAYRLGMGDFRVFEQQRGDNARLVIMMDTSGSMSDYEEPEDRRGRHVNGATLAWDITAALTERYPQAEVLTFRSWQRSHEKYYSDWGALAGTIIQPVPVGYRLAKQTGANSDCAMLLWLEEYLEGDLGGATVVLISDGYPSGGTVMCESIGHTKQIARDLHEKGLRYISVLVKQSYNDLYPADVTACIREEGDYDELVEAFAELDARGF